MCPLTQCKPGETVFIRGFLGGLHMRQKLQAMGLIPGEAVEIVSGSNGPLVICAKGVKLALGRGMAENIMVSCDRCCLCNSATSNA
ncbi:MAG: ferrous iron transport protein A [Desulfuromonadaceae bacterium]|nr:ferrous iron transport protein A [Desulfuromonadaceae bacterium]